MAKWFEKYEHLATGEIKNELRARGLDASGERRTIAARLRDVLNFRKKNPGAAKIYPTGVPSYELEYITRTMEKLRGLLNQVSLEVFTHEKFMTLFIHMEGRLRRIPSRDKELDR